MKTLEHPTGHIVDETVEPPPSFAEHLIPFEVSCTNPVCGAKLLVDATDDLLYKAQYIMYADEMRFVLVVICPHCDVVLDVEEYGAPGNPATQAPTSAWRIEIPLRLRATAYRRWESDPSKNRSYWKMFFGSDAVRGWSLANQRAARKMRSRLCPDYTLDALRNAGFTEVEIRRLNRLIIPHVNGLLQRTDESFAEVVAGLRARLDAARKA